MLVFSTQICKLTFSLVQLSRPPSPFPVWISMGFCWRPYCAELNTLYLTRFRTYKIDGPPQTKT
jgi:hypothetical protein